MNIYARLEHRILFIPIDVTLLTSSFVTNVAGSGLSFASILEWVTEPLIYVKHLDKIDESRIRTVNPIGTFYNEIQSFGHESPRYVMDGYISPLEYLDDSITNKHITSLTTQAKVSILNEARLNYVRFYLVTNIGYDVVIITKQEIKESDTNVFEKSVSLNLLSTLPKSSYKVNLNNIVNDIAFRSVVQNILPILTF